jgi:putative transcriptional regulator
VSDFPGGLQNNIKEARQQKRLTQAQLADIVRVSRQTIISIEICKYVPSVLLSIKISKALGKNIEDLFWLEESD